MVCPKNQAWIVSVFSDDDVKKAIVLAGSLRRVMTTKKIVAVFTENLSDESRILLREKFDLTVAIDQRIPDDMNVVDFSKIFLFSLNIFHKCVYLSTSTLVLQNCDTIFETYDSFAAHFDKANNCIDTSVFLFTPCTRRYKAMRTLSGKELLNGKTCNGDVTAKLSGCFGKWIQSQENLRVEPLDARHNQKISLFDEKEIYDGLHSDLLIVNFVDIHPIDIADQILASKITNLGIVESFIADKWLTIYSQETKLPQSQPTIEQLEYDWDNEPIAIIGMSCRLPGANNVNDFWNLLVEGQEGIKLLPSHRWTKDRTIMRAQTRDLSAGFLDIPIDEFDAKFFGISPKEAMYLDPQQRLLHEICWEALEDGAVDPISLRGTHTGIFVGSWIYDYKDIVNCVPDSEFLRIYMGNSIASGAARLSHFLGTTGPSFATESGCSSAIVAVDTAVKSLKSGEINLAIVGGVNILVHPYDNSLLSMVVAPDGRCKTFDANANGFGRAEGCGVLILKRLSGAVTDGDKIWGVIRGSAVTQEGLSKSLGTPTVHCEALAMKLALKDGGVDPIDVSFVETHGTGTIVGDPMEVAAIAKVYSSPKREQPLIIGSVKTNVGHTESASGITGIIKVVLSMKNSTIPKHLNFDTLNPDINLEQIPAVLPLENIPWPKNTSGKPRIAGVSSFGISGTDGHIIIQEAPEDEQNEISCFNKLARPLHIMKISAKSSQALHELFQRHKISLELDEKISLVDYFYTANVGRSSFNFRSYLIADEKETSLNILSNPKMIRKREVDSNPNRKGKLCFIFPGQGCEYLGMAQMLYKTSPIFKMSFDKCSALLKSMYKMSIKDIVWSSNTNGNLKTKLFYIHTSIFCVEYSLLKLWNSWGVKPDYVLGHGLGEFAAAVGAGALDLKSALKLVAERSRMVDALPSGRKGRTMNLEANKQEIDTILKEFTDIHGVSRTSWLDYVALNSSKDSVLAGHHETVARFSSFCDEKRVKHQVSSASEEQHSVPHTRIMEIIFNDYWRAASKSIKAEKLNTNCKYISSIDGKILEKGDLITPKYWTRHNRTMVNFTEACKTAKREGCTIFIEIGPQSDTHPSLLTLIKRNIKFCDDITEAPLTLPSFSGNKDDNEWKVILESLGELYLSDWKGSINWSGVDEYYQRSRKAVLPFYPFNRKKVWIDAYSVPSRVHPLLGIPRNNASAKMVFYENIFSIGTRFAPYLADHVIGSSFVLPGAAFMELCLAGGYAHVQGFKDKFQVPQHPIALQGFKIESPLGLSDSKTTRVQTVISVVSGVDEIATGGTYKAKVFHLEPQEEDAGHWVTHVTAYFSPFVTINECYNVDISKIQETWQESTVSSDMYKKLPEVGLRFGPTFQSLEKGWKNEEEDKFLVQVKVPEGISNYIAHPILVDAMIQGAMLWNGSKEDGRLHKKLHVPVGIDNFTWLTTTDSNDRFIYCAKDENSDVVRVTMLDENGTALMTISGVEFIETTASVVESMIQQQGCKVPKMWEEIWRHKAGPLEFQMPYVPVEGSLISDEDMPKILELNKLDEEDTKVLQHLDGSTVMFFLHALYELGWDPKQGNNFTLEQVMSELKIVEAFTNFTRFFLKCLIIDGYLNSEQKDAYTIIKFLPTKQEVDVATRETVTESEKSRADYKLIFECGKNLSDILIGKTHPLAVIFPEGSGMELTDSFYEIIHGKAARSLHFLLDSVLQRRYASEVMGEKKTWKLRILEVGAGTGMHTGMFLEHLGKLGLNFEFHFTDISAAFFNKAEEKFEKFKNQLVFRKLNIEEDPLAQGFCPGYYDMVLAAEVLHATRSVRETLTNIRILMRDGANIQIAETTKQDKRYTFVFGLLEGYWRFQDFDLRPDHATLSPEAWENVLNSCGFEKAVAVPAYNFVHSGITALATETYKWDPRWSLAEKKELIWIIFGDEDEEGVTSLGRNLQKKLASFGRSVKYLRKSQYLNKISKEFFEEIAGKVEASKDKEPSGIEGIIYLWGLVDQEERNQKTIQKPFFYLCQYLWDNQKLSPKTIVVTSGIQKLDDSAPTNPSPSTILGLCKVLRTETPLDVKCIDLPVNKTVVEMTEHIFFEIWYNLDEEDTIAFRSGKRHCPRYATAKVPNDTLPLPKGSDRFQLILPSTLMVQDLQFTFLNCYTLGENEIEIKIKATALNFRDVFAVIKPDPLFDKINAIGTDFAGVVTAIGSKVTQRKVGDCVFGINYSVDQALPSHIKALEERVIEVPDYMTFAEAATLPAVFATAFYCLITVANIKKEDTVLIHTASGGVGLSAIQVAQHIGAKIICTAGSERKRAYLRKHLGIEHVFHSRNTDFGDQILEVTGGKGVDIVLNSLTGPGFKEASLKCSGQGARFVEMSKLNIWKPEEVKELRPDVDYTVADLQTLGDDTWKQVHEKIKEHVNTDRVKPIPYVRFDAVNIRAALNYLQKAKHIGKIVVIMPEIKMQDNKFKAMTPVFNDRSTYIITGAITGGIGLETAKYMLSQGAKHLILLGRSEPNEKSRGLLKMWEDEGKNVHAWQVDVGDYDKVKEILEMISGAESGFPPVRGVMHAAGVLQDATIPNQTWEKFELVYNPKINGSWNLHDLTKNYSLEHFVYFSSLAAIFGTPGQANHTSANFFEDALSHFRDSLGLPSITINWGSWGQVGIATEVEVPGFRPLSTQQGLQAMDLILRTNRGQTGVMNVESFSVFAKYCPRIKNYIDDKSLFADVKTPIFSINSDEFWEEVDSVDDREGKEEVFRKNIKIMLRTILKMEQDEPIDDHVEFQTLGVDSLMMLEMKNNMQNLFGNRMTVSASDLKGCNTTHLLSAKLVDILLSSSSAEEVLPTLEELQLLIQEDAQLPKTVITNAQNAHPGVIRPSKIKTVFITGITGVFGPFILRLVAKMPQITEIVCIIRKRGKLDAQERLIAALTDNGLLPEIPLDKVRCLEGDVTQPRLGMKEEEYEELAESMDSVIHLAAKLDHIQCYRKTSAKEKFHLRTINVIGTKHVLEFATLKRKKLFFNASSFGIIYSANEEKGCLSEEWEDLSNPTDTDTENVPGNPAMMGYSISKFVVEQMMKQAVQTGILPCKSFRLAAFCGDSKTGWNDIRGNHFMLRFMTYLKVGAMSSIPLPMVQLPVDYLAEVTVRLFFDDNVPHEAFNVIPRTPEMEQEFSVQAEKEFGRKIEIVEHEEFVERAKKLGNDSPIHAFIHLYEDFDLVKRLQSCPAIPSCEQYQRSDFDRYFHSEKLEKYCPDLYATVDSPLNSVMRDIRYQKGHGMFEKFGL